MNDNKILENAPSGATHVAFSHFDSGVKYFQTDTNEINIWYHWVEDTRHHVDFDFSVVFDNIRSLDDIKKIVALEAKQGNTQN